MACTCTASEGSRMVELPQDDQSKIVVEEFERHFGSKPCAVACGPGRVNLIGEHTDYQGGHVFPMALDLKCSAAGSFNDSGRYNFYSMNMKDMAEFPEFPAKPGNNHEWWNYAVGSMAMYFEHTKLPVPKGCNVVVNSTVPLGGGVSSSAALEVAMASLMECLTTHHLEPLEKAEMCQKAEHVWAGVGCGLMDQAISVMGKANKAMLFDCKLKQTQYADMPDTLRVVVVDCGIRHKLVDGEYEKRKASCVEAVTAIKKRHPDVTFLRDCTMEWLNEAKDEMSEETFQRGKHVITECARCTRFADELNKGHFDAAGQIMYEGQSSLAHDYNTSIPQVDKIIEIAKPIEGVYGARMTGGGFGGCVVVLCKTPEADRVMETLLNKYTAYYLSEGKKLAECHQSFAEPKAFIVAAKDGAHFHKL